VKRCVLGGIGVGIVLVLPLILEHVVYYPLEVFTGTGFAVMLAVSLMLIVGQVGEISLGHAAFYGIGAYTGAILSLRYGWPPILSVGAGGVMGALFGYLIGAPVLRLKGYYLALATLGVGIAAQEFFRAAGPMTGGEVGLYDIPPVSLGPWAISSYVGNYYLVWAVALIFVVLTQRVCQSPFGQTLRAIHSDEWAAQSVGINVPRAKLQVFVLSSGMAGCAGALFAHCGFGTVSPADFGVGLSIRVITMVIIGGAFSVYGAVAGAVLLSLLPEVVRGVGSRGALELTRITHIQDIVFGVILVLFVILWPQGLVRGRRTEVSGASSG